MTTRDIDGSLTESWWQTMMGRCKKYPDEGECHGHDCIDRVGTPCIFDKFMKAGTEDIVIDEWAEVNPYLKETVIGVDLAPNADTFIIFSTEDVPQYACDMGTCPDNFDRTNYSCAGCNHFKVKEVNHEP